MTTLDIRDLATMTQFSVLLAIGLIALLIIWLVARNMEDARGSGVLRWVGDLFRSTPDRGNWSWMDRRLARVPELTMLDRRERRQLYLDAERSWWDSHRTINWVVVLTAGVCVAISQPWADRLSVRLSSFSRSWPIAGQVPPWLFEFSWGVLIYVAVFMILFHVVERGISGRLMEMLHSSGACGDGRSP